MLKKLFIEYFFLFFLGVMTSLSLPPFNYFIINFFTFTAFFLFLIKKISVENIKTFFSYGWFFGFGYFLSSLYWISISLTFDNNFKILIPLSLILIPAFLAIFYGSVSLLFRVLKTKKILRSFLLFSVIFGTLEFLRGSILTGFPWNLIVYSFSNQLEILSITSIIGTYGLNLMSISLFTSPAIFFFLNKKRFSFVSVFFIISFIFFYFYGSVYQNKFNDFKNIKNDFKVRIIGSDINLDRFYSDIDSNAVIKDLIDISDPNLNEKIIFIWPEGILPGVTQNEFHKFSHLFEERFNKNHLIILGINDQVRNNENFFFYNSLAIYDYQLNLLHSYNKIKLVPFGEFLPFEKILKNIGLKTITNNYQSFSKGDKRDVINIKDDNFALKILPLICYEIIYTGNISDNFDFDLIVNISEDGWFGNSIGPDQHFAHSIFRAIENRKYVIRSANNGIAAIINPLGKIEQKISLGQNGYLDFYSYKESKQTIFSKYGNSTFILISFFYIFFIFLLRK